MAVGSERGTTNLDVLAADQMFAAGTVTGSVVNAGTMNLTKGVFSSLDVTGTVTGSFITGTMAPTDFIGSSIKRSHMLASSGTIEITVAAPGTFLHGLGAAPSFVSIVPINSFGGAAGTEGMPLYYNAAPDATAVYVAGGTTGTAWVYALA